MEHVCGFGVVTCYTHASISSSIHEVKYQLSDRFSLRVAQTKKIYSLKKPDEA